MSEKVYIVAEIGCNHNGNLNIAKHLLLKAKEAGADYAKFQLFKTELLVTESAGLASYQKKNTNEVSQFQMLKKLELSRDEYIDIIKYAENIGIQVFATAFDIESAEILAGLGQRIWKIPSGEITNLPLLEKIAGIKCSDKEIVLSTGMSTLDEIEAATKVLEKSKDTKFIILQCNTQYPTLDTDMNLLVMDTLRENFPKWQVGLSDHSEGVVAALTSVGMGAVFIEKHFTLDKNMEGPDHKASITPAELKELCDGVRRSERMLGNPEKRVTSSEIENRSVARKSIVAAVDIKKGEVFSEKNLTCKRPGTGISPMKWHEVVGTVADKAYRKDEAIVYVSSDDK